MRKTTVVFAALLVSHLASYAATNEVDGNWSTASAGGSFTETGLNLPRGSKPNIVLILMDDMGYNDIGVQTYPSPPNHYPNSGPEPVVVDYPDKENFPEPNVARLMTPRIDSLAEDGLLMTSFHTARLCSPSRASLLTGRYASRMNMDRVFHHNTKTGFSTEEVTLAELLREQGYQTGLVGKWHLGYNASQRLPFQMTPTRSGFHEFFGFPWSNDGSSYRLLENERVVRTLDKTESTQNGLTWEITEAALGFIERSSAKDAPFFLHFCHIMTHTPCWPSSQQYQNADGTIWPIFKGTSGESYYYDAMKEIDHSVGRVLDKLDDLGIADDTIVIFTSDNGPWLSHSKVGGRIVDKLDSSVGSAYPLRDGKFTTWEGGTRVPFMVRWPNGIAAGTVSDALAGLIDLTPTLVSIVDGEMPDDRTIDGIDLWPVWSGQINELDRTYAVFNDGTAQGVLKGDWKLRNGELYDLNTDIQEQTDLSGVAAYADILAELQAFQVSIQSSAASDVIALGTYTDYEVEFSENDIHVPEGGTATVDIRLSHDPGTNVTVTFAPFSGDADLSVSSGNATVFTASDWSDWKTVTLAAAQDADGDHSGATFRVTMSGLDVVRELFAFEVDDEAAAATVASLVWPKVQSLSLSDESVKFIAEGSGLIGAQTDPAGTIYGWRKVSGPGAVNFTDAASQETGVSFSAMGTYVLRLIVDHSSAGAFDVVDFTVVVGPQSSFGDYKYSPVLAYDATTDKADDSIWVNEITPGIRSWVIDPDVTRTTSDPAGQLSFIDASYDFPGGSVPDGITSDSLDEYSTGDASFEFWFKPDRLPVSSPQVLWETGGDVGTSFTLNGSQIRLAVDDASGALAEATLVSTAEQDGFVHCVGVIDLANEQIKLYLDGSLMDTEPIPGVSDWCGSSATGLGTISDSSRVETTTIGHLGGNDQLTGSFDPFAGLVAHMLFYDRALTDTQIADLSSGPRAAPIPSNVGPVVSAGGDQSVSYTGGAALSGTASDDGLPDSSMLITLWRQYSGPGTPTIADDSLLSTSADFDLPGTYQLWLEADDGEIMVYDEVDITVASYTYAEWVVEEGLPFQQDGVRDNPDGDSHSNFWEWVRGSDPQVFNVSEPLGQVVASATSDAAHFTFTFDVPRNRTPNLWIETSEDLVNWNTVLGLVPQVEILDSDASRWVFELEIDSSSFSKVFARPVGAP